jgi:hypothetical protein
MRGNIAIPVMIVLHSAGGIAIDVNTDQITHLRNPDPNIAAFTKDARCMINMTDGKFVTVIESCREVLNIMGNRKNKK